VSLSAHGLSVALSASQSGRWRRHDPLECRHGAVGYWRLSDKPRGSQWNVSANQPNVAGIEASKSHCPGRDCFLAFSVAGMLREGQRTKSLLAQRVNNRSAPGTPSAPCHVLQGSCVGRERGQIYRGEAVGGEDETVVVSGSGRGRRANFWRSAVGEWLRRRLRAIRRNQPRREGREPRR
jgi:hypothetical protein